ncbi:MAG: hypothetical protein FXF54_09970 [Kosmotoga sp.]|nr:MAG: hypothetical protein FXF54_09970 [Kosmotoga sp.]
MKNSKKLLKNITKHKCVSIVGLEKNTGKTETMNFITRNIHKKLNIAITSIGLDGESFDQIAYTPKPPVNIFDGMVFATCEAFYREKKFLSEILYINEHKTPLGRTVIAKAKENGQIVLAGPVINAHLKELVNDFKRLNSELIIIDGAFSRISHSSPLISDAVILATGAAVSLNINILVNKTLEITKIMSIEQYSDTPFNCERLEHGMFLIDDKTGEITRLPFDSTITCPEGIESHLLSKKTLFISGAITGSFLRMLVQKGLAKDLTVIARDYTRIFASLEDIERFEKKGGSLKVMYNVNLIGITINPWSPAGYKYSSSELIDTLQSRVNVPVVDVLGEDN